MNDRADEAQPLDVRVLERTAERLAVRYAGVLSPEVVERVVFESYTALSRTARVRTHLAALAGHFAGDRLAALAHSQSRQGPPQVLFVGRHDTGRA
ncbi:three-helix bundle dimerization domain-containing protein, partial [Kocuria oceani]